MATPTLALSDIQGNSLGGFNKDFQANLFLKFTSAAAGRAWITEISDDVADSSSGDVLDYNNEFKRLKKAGQAKPEALIQALWVNLAISFQGLKALGINATDLAKFPPAFSEGMAARAATIGDAGNSAPANWIPPFTQPSDIHAVLLIAADHPGVLQKNVTAITTSAKFTAGVTILLNQAGRTRPDLPGHEHFGFKDGISQPGVRGVDPPDDPIANPNQAHPGQDLLWPGEFVVGYPTQIPKLGTDGISPNPSPGPVSASGPAWTVNGSYLVFRRLRQDVPAFEKNVKALAKTLGWSEDLTGAKLVGRYKSGCPIEKTEFHPLPYTPPSNDPADPHHGNPLLATSNTLNNNFEFDDDPIGSICPMSAHVRKAYPRDEFTPAGNPPNHPDDSESATQTRRVLRRGIPYGAPYDPHDAASATVDRGLLFLAYQNDIQNHFEFIQSAWVNNAGFPPTPPGIPPLLGAPGVDPIMSQTPNGNMLIDPTKPPVSINHFVITTGGEYFFSPSISALEGIGDGTIT
jgi:Dyp-type peroxidase family